MPFPDYEPALPAFLERLAARGDRELIVQDDRRLTYAEAEQRSARLARGLLGLGVGKGSHVGILFPNGPEWVLAFLATCRIGAVAVPINTFYKARELGWTLRHADVHTLLTADAFLGNDYLARLEEAAPSLTGAASASEPLRAPELPFLRNVAVAGDGGRPFAHRFEDLEDRPGESEALLSEVEREVCPADTMLLLYSSGSTAAPKGALHTHETVLRHSFNLTAHRDLKESDRVWSPMPFFWVGGLVFAFLGNLQAGATTLCEERFEPGQTLAFLERERATVAVGWPHFGQALASHPDAATRDLSALRAGNVPEILPPELVPLDPRRRSNALGMTETCGPHTWSEGPLPEALAGSFGRAVPGVEHKVIDPETGATLPPGEFGEICIRGYSLMQGLYKIPRSETFEEDGFYRTGDGGSFDENGILWFQARLGDMIKTGGANVTPAEVEGVLASDPEVRAAFVVGLPDPERGQNVAAAVVLETGFETPAAELKARVKRELSAYKVPRHLWVFADGTLPFTDSGKIDKKRLTALLEERVAAGDMG